MSKTNNQWQLFNAQLPETIIPVGANKRLARKLNSKIWGMRGTEGAWESSDLFPGVVEGHVHVQGCVVPRKELRTF